MQYQRFDHTLTLKMTSDMRDDIDRALILVQDTLISTRSEFLRAACQYALDSLAGGWADAPVSIEERKERVLAGADDLDADLPGRVQAKSDEDYPRPRCA
jgi:Arc/MetJ-type ribon-helix-helix transcriptional regulator